MPASPFDPPRELSILTPRQLATLRQALLEVQGAGFGEVWIIVENHAIKFIVKSVSIPAGTD